MNNSTPKSKSNVRLQFGLGLACLAMLVMLADGCAHPLGRRSSVRAEVRSLELTNASGRPVSMDVLQSEVMRFADTYAVTVAEGVDDLIAKVSSPETKIAAIRWKLAQASSAFIDATGANAALNALDMVVLATISRMVMEDEMNRVFGPVSLPLLAKHRQLESNSWAAVSSVLKPEQLQELKALIQEWRQNNPNQRYVAATRLRELAAVMGKTSRTASPTGGSLFSLLYLDPFAGLDPTAEAIQQTRQLAERAMYYTQRMPTLLSWQAQLLTLQLLAQQETKGLLDDAERLSRSTERVSLLADQLPGLVNDQRQAAIQQIFDGLAAERTNWLASLAGGQQKGSEFLSETRQTLNAANNAAAGVNTAIKSLDDFVRSVSPIDTNRAPSGTNSRPFNVLDYGTAASEIGVATKDLNALLLTLNQSMPTLSRQITGDAKQLLYRAFWLGVAFTLIVLCGLVLAGLTYRALDRKLCRNTFPPPGSQSFQNTNSQPGDQGKSERPEN